jgi:hypothetical protein
MEKFEPIEPLKSNRWIIRTYPFEITDFLFREYKMYNEGEEIILETSFFETIHHVYTPKEIMDITDLSIEYLDPIGNVVNGLKMSIKGVNFEKHHSYSDDGLMVTKLRFILKKIDKYFKNNETQSVSHGQPKE